MLGGSWVTHGYEVHGLAAAPELISCTGEGL